MSRRTELKAFATVINFAGMLVNIGAAVYFHDKTDAYIANVLVAIFCGVLMIANFFGYLSSSFADEERRVREELYRATDAYFRR